VIGAEAPEIPLASKVRAESGFRRRTTRP